MSLFACTWLALAAVPCTERGVVLFDSGPGPDDATRQAIAEQLQVELSALGYQRCDDGLPPTQVSYRWWSPQRVTLQVTAQGRTRTRTIEREPSALPLAVAVFTAELLRDPLRADPEPAVEGVAGAAEPRAQPGGWRLAAVSEVLFSQGATVLGGGSLELRKSWSRLWVGVGAGAVGAAPASSPSGVVRTWGLTGRLLGGARLFGTERLAVELGAELLALALKVDGLSRSSATGRSSWSPSVAARLGPGLRGELGQLALGLSAGVGYWLPGLAVVDGTQSVRGVWGVEGWVHCAAGVAW